jgi:hypothetical protein
MSEIVWTLRMQGRIGFESWVGSVDGLRVITLERLDTDGEGFNKWKWFVSPRQFGGSPDRALAPGSWTAEQAQLAARPFLLSWLEQLAAELRGTP